MIRFATKEDIPSILLVIADAKALFQSHQSDQWQDSDGYPNIDTFLQDIEQGVLYVEEQNDQVVGVACISDEEEIAYRNIFEGHWLTLNNQKAMVVHRLAIKKEYYRTGIAKRFLRFAETLTREKNYASIRIDTHEKNIEMNQLLLHLGYTRCGIIYLSRQGVINNKRTAYEKIIYPIDLGKKGLIFDMDGTMIDSMRYWVETGELLFREMFQDADFDVYQALDNMSAWELATQIFNQRGDKEGKRAFIKRWNDRMLYYYMHRVTLHDGLIEVLDYYKKKGMVLCVATGTNVSLAEPILDKLGILHYFDFIVTEEMVGKSKHQPDIFVYTCQKLSLPISECMVFEDAYHAARSAQRVGLAVVGIYDEISKRSTMRLKNYCDDYLYSYREYLQKIKRD
jgi:HAD superfamily hydrolase (TIGR01509 family)